MSGLRIGGVSLAFLLSLAACAPHPPAREAPGVSAAGRPPEAILQTFEQRWQAVEELRALARVSVTSVQGRYSTRETFMWRRPSALRLDAVDVFGQSAMVLVADDVRASIYYPHQGVFFQGPSTAANLSRFIGLPLDVEDVAHLLAGHIQPGPKHPWAWVDYQWDHGAHLLRFVGAGGELLQDAWVDADQLLPARVIRYTGRGELAVDALYADFQTLTEAFPFPFSLTISLPLAQTELRIRFIKVDLNSGLTPSTFHLSPPEGVRVLPLE